MLVCDKGARAPARLRSAVERGSSPRDGFGLGPLLDDATSLLGAASASAAVFGLHRVSAAAQLLGGDVHLNDEDGVVKLKAKCQEDNQ